MGQEVAPRGCRLSRSKRLRNRKLGRSQALAVQTNGPLTTNPANVRFSADKRVFKQNRTLTADFEGLALAGETESSWINEAVLKTQARQIGFAIGTAKGPITTLSIRMQLATDLVQAQLEHRLHAPETGQGARLMSSPSRLNSERSSVDGITRLGPIAIPHGRSPS